MKKSNKVLGAIIAIIYVAVGVGWLISMLSQYKLIKGNFAAVYEILYFVPSILMLIIAGIEICRLVKGKYKVIDALFYLILPVVLLIAAFIVPSGSETGTYTIIEFVVAFHVVKSLAAIGAGLAALILAGIKVKTEK
ncbi:hypothetical protein [Blautia stercoris]|jgi:hypothetical protein